MFDNVAALLDNLVAKLKPTKVLYLAIDGVAPRAKMNQQRARRFRSQADAKQVRAIEAKLRVKMGQQGQPVPPPRPPAWDHNVITPGTKFMADLTIYLIDVAGGDKVPRKGGPGVTQSDVFVINKTDLAEIVSSSAPNLH